MSNRDKVGTPFQSSDPLEGALETKPEVSFVAPTTLVDLPSKGKFYPDGHPLKDKEDVEIYFMTTKAEDILTNKAFIKKGIAIDRMLQSMLVDKTLQLDTLLVGDKNALVIGARITGYGPQYKTKFTCPSCDEPQEFEFNLETASIIHEGDKSINITKEGTFFCELPRTKLTVECKLLTGKEEKEILFAAEKKKKNKMNETMMTDQLKIFISSIGGNRDKGYINNVVDNMPALDSRWLRNQYKLACPNIDLKQDFTCSVCEFEEEVTVPLGTDLFWSF